MTKYVYDFVEGNRELADLLGGKGANLAEMTNLGLPVPPGFTITTGACRAYLQAVNAAAGSGPSAATHAGPALPDGLAAEVAEHLRGLERSIGRRLGDPADPLLVSVRSGAQASMPGMMETILNVGLNDATIAGLITASGDERFAWDSYRRLIQMFGHTVFGVPDEDFAVELDAAKRAREVTADSDLVAADLQELVERYKKIFFGHTGREFPQGPQEQLDLAIRAVFASWDCERAVHYRRQERIPADLGTAVSVVAMVFGNLGPDSGTGVAFTRDPATGAPGVYGDYLANAQGEDVVAGVRDTVPLHELATIDPAAYRQLQDIMATLEAHYRDLCDIEFTIERGRLWMLQTRVGKRTAAAAFVIACQLVDEGVLDLDEALTRVSGEHLAALMFPAFDLAAGGVAGGATAIATGIGASPGAAVGRVVLDAAQAVEWAARGEDVILVRPETNPDDLPGMIAAQGVLTGRGGKTSHAAVVARGMGKTCVCGAAGLRIDVPGRQFIVDGVTVGEGDIVSIDGTTGAVYLGAVAMAPSPVVRYFEGTLAADAGPLVAAVDRLLRHADARARLAVRTNADSGKDAARARRFGATGVGLCRTEHMFLGERRELVERLILADDETEQRAALDALLPLQRADFVDLFAAMDGLPVTVRLIDPPLHEFLPRLEELAVTVAVAQARGEDPGRATALLAAVRRMHEENPMLGLRGVRLGLVVPGLFAMQVRAIAEAAAQHKAGGGDPHPEIMVPLVAAVPELAAVRADAERVLADVQRETGVEIRALIGTMIEVPRAALTAGQIAAQAEFFSFGTNDLTQMTWGFSRDDVEAAFFDKYLELGVFGVSPFESIDTDGVGSLVRTAVQRGRAARPDLHLGVCGEHGGDPASVHFFHEVGLDYVSCSPFRVPVARLEAGRAAVLGR